MSKRAIFEDVATGTRDRTPAPAATRAPARRAISAWLWLLAGLVALMIVVGGLTRLTDSGLSITVWDPVMGVIPPLSDADWQAAFDAYKTTTEYQEQNAWMTLEDFKPIYWWEWGHRFLGRVIGIVWLAGLVAFLALRKIPPGWTWKLVLPGALGGLQGAIGWWMVSGGLVGALDVPSYRLATHLGLAFVILMLLSWYALKIRLEPVALLQARRMRPAWAARWTGMLGAAVFLQIVVGALVAGIDAGRSYPEWPTMEGAFLPSDMMVLQPWWRNLFENAGTVQWVHRMLGYAVLLLGLVVAWRLAAPGLTALKRRGRWLLAALFGQVAVGIVTVIYAAPLEIAIFHQAGAILVIWLLMRARFAALYPEPQRITA